MLIRFISLAALLSLPAASGGTAGPPGQERPPAPAADLKPFTVTVVDEQTGKPVTEFSYSFGYYAPGRVSPFKKVWQAVESPSATFVVQAPPACILYVGVRSPDFKVDTAPFSRFVVRSTDNARRTVLKLDRGVTVRGIVRDATTRRPIAGAIVSPKLHYGMISNSDVEDRQATTDQDGHYELHGVDLESSVTASHPDYREQDVGGDAEKKAALRLDVDLKPVDRVTLRGTVRDVNGRPLEACTVIPCSGREWPGTLRDLNGRLLGGVTVSDHEKRVQTARDGTFALPLVIGGREYGSRPIMIYSKEGYVTRTIWPQEIPKDGVVVLEHEVSLDGQVLSADGQPVRSFTVRAEPASELPGSAAKSAERNVQDPAGRFKLWLDQAGRTRVRVRAMPCKRGCLDQRPAGRWLAGRAARVRCRYLGKSSRPTRRI